MPQQPETDGSIHRLARFENRVHRWREHRARKRGKLVTVVPFNGYGGAGWVRVLARVIIVRPPKKTKDGESVSVRGWRTFTGIPIGNALVRVEIGGTVHELTADRGGVIDQVLQIDLAPGWQSFTMSAEGQEPVPAQLFVVGENVDFGIVSDIDDTVMITMLPRPFVAAWNVLVVEEHARRPVPGMAVLLDQLIAQHPGAPMVYLSTGAWNVVPTLKRFLSRHLFPKGAMLLTDWGPTHDRWFRSGRAHKLDNLVRLTEEFPGVRWLLFGDDGQHDEAIYADFQAEHPDAVAAVAIRRLSTAEAVRAGGRSPDPENISDAAPWVIASDGAAIREKLSALGLLR